MPNVGGCRHGTEAIRTHAEDMRQTQTEWDAGTKVDTESFADGALRLTASNVAKIANTTGSDDLDNTAIANGGRWAMTNTPIVVWALDDAIGSAPMMRSVGLYLDRRRNAANANFDGTFVVQLYTVGWQYSRQMSLFPVCGPLYKTARSMSADAELVTFSLDTTGNNASAPQQFPIADFFRPIWINKPLGTPAPYLIGKRTIVAQLYTLGGSNTNYAWITNNAGANEQTTAGAGTLYHLTATDIDLGDSSNAGVETLRLDQVAGTGMPRITFTVGSYPASGTVTFTNIDLGAAPSGTLEFVVNKQTPTGTSILVEASDDGGVAWSTVVDGCTPATASPALTAQQTYRMRATLSSPASRDVTPTLRGIGVRDKTTQDWTGFASYEGEHESVDPLTGQVRIGDVTLSLQLNGVRDYNGVERFLSENLPGSVQVRRYVAHPDLDRQYWMYDALWDVLTYKLDPTQARIHLVSVMNRLKGRVPRATGTVYGYLLKAANSDLTGGANFTKEMSVTAESSGTLTATIAGSATEVDYAITPANVPGFLQFPDGDFTQEVEVTTANANIYLKMRLSRVNAAGTVQQSTAYTEETQLSTTGIKTFSWLGVEWAAGASTDRLRADYSFRNADAGSQAVTIRTGTTDTELKTPWLPVFQALPQSYDSQTIDAAFTSVRDSLIGLPERYRGNLPGNTTDKVSKEVFAQDGLDCLREIAFADGQAVIASQGVIKCVNLHKPKGVAVAGFTHEELNIESIDTGLHRRVPEFFVPCRYDGSKFTTEVRTVHAAALAAYGTPTIETADPRYDAEAAKWLPNETLANRIGKWIVTTHGMGQFMAEGCHTTYAWPELELGDVVFFQTDRLTFYDPVSARAIRGNLWALGVIVAKRDSWGRLFDIWIPNPTDLYGSTSATHRRDPYEPVRVALIDRSAPDRLDVAQVLLQASASGASIYYRYRASSAAILDYGDYQWSTYTAGDVLELLRDQSAVKYLDVYAEANNLRSAIHAFPIQADATATITTLTATEPAGGTVRWTATGVDANVRSIRWYIRRNAAAGVYPTLDSTATGVLDETYLIDEYAVAADRGGQLYAQQTGYGAGDDSSVIAVPIDFNGNPGTRASATYAYAAAVSRAPGSATWALNTAGSSTVERTWDITWTAGTMLATDDFRIKVIVDGTRYTFAEETTDPTTTVTKTNVALSTTAGPTFFPSSSQPTHTFKWEWELRNNVGTLINTGTVSPTAGEGVKGLLTL